MQLSPQSHALVEATAAVVAEHANAITSVFYPTMFAAHPELQNVFNQANQAVGEQPRALAASVVAFAVQLIDPAAPDFSPVMRRIAHKHVSLGITASSYTIVGHHLIAAVKTVLGEVVTPEIAAAWDEVYWLFATALIAEEARLYALGGTDPAQPWREYRVAERFEEAEGIFSLLLAPLEGEVPAHHTGQYVAVEVELPGGLRQPRQYTISSGPRGDTLRVTIKRVLGENGAPNGLVSGWLYEHAVPGAVLNLSQPAGDVVLDSSDDPLVLVSAGIGITPVAAIMSDLSRRQPGRTVRMFHADESHGTHALYSGLRRQVLAMDDARAQNWYAERADDAPTLHPAKTGRMSLEDVELPEGARVFMCGSLSFMQTARRELVSRGVPTDRIHYEVFGPDMWAQNPA